LPHIFILDDDEDLLLSQRLVLESAGFSVSSAFELEPALESIRTIRPDLILVDLMMEHYDTGFVFAKKVRDTPSLSGVPVIMQTAASEKLRVDLKSLPQGDQAWTHVDEILTKPVAGDTLVATIRRHLA